MNKTLTKVVERHPDTVRERLWRTGIEEHSLLYCGGEVTVTVSLKKAKIRIVDHSMLYYSGEVPANIMIVMQLKIWVGYKTDKSGDETIFKRESDEQLSGGYCCI